MSEGTHQERKYRTSEAGDSSPAFRTPTFLQLGVLYPAFQFRVSVAISVSVEIMC